MPQLRFHAISLDYVQAVSQPLTEELSAIIKCAREHFVLECVASTYVWDGQEVEGHPFVEVYCFDRGEEAYDRMAETITRHLKGVGCPSVDVTFLLLERRRYYEDDLHF